MKIKNLITSLLLVCIFFFGCTTVAKQEETKVVESESQIALPVSEPESQITLPVVEEIQSSICESGKEYELYLFHTNDHHGSSFSVDGCYGLAERSTYLKQMRTKLEGKNILLFDAGDLNTGTTFSNMYKAEPDILAFNKIGYDGITFGNHEFDINPEDLLHQIEISTFPWINCNVKKQDGSFLGIPYIVKDYEGFRVGITGVTTMGTDLNSRKNFPFIMEDEIPAVESIVKVLREEKKCDIVILISHLGDKGHSRKGVSSVKLASEVNGLDIIVDGHDHTYMFQPLTIKGTEIVSAGEWGKYVGCGKLVIKDRKLEKFIWTPTEITSKDFPPDQEILDLLAPYKEKSDALLNEVIMHSESNFKIKNRSARYGETAFGDFIADGFMWYAKKIGYEADFAIINGGGIRSGCSNKEITVGDILTALPYSECLHIVDIKGDNLIKLFAYIETITQGAGAFPQISSDLRYILTYNKAGKEGKISDITINGKEIDQERVYKVAMPDYLLTGGDNYPISEIFLNTYNTSKYLSTIIIEYAKSFTNSVVVKEDGRITVVKGYKY